MAKRSSRVYFFRHLFRMLFRERETVSLAVEDATIPAGYQGMVSIDLDLCRGCGLCARACPANAVEVMLSDDDGVTMIIYHDRCAVCGLCEVVCASGAIERQPAFSAGATQREALRQVWRQEKAGTQPPCS